MNAIIGARFTMCRAKTLEKLLCHLFSGQGQPQAISDHLRSDLELWLDHHTFDELPDALEYYPVNPNSDLDSDLTNLDLLDRRGVRVTIHLRVTMTIHLLLDWTKCFFNSFGEYPGLKNLLNRKISIIFPLVSCSC